MTTFFQFQSPIFFILLAALPFLAWWISRHGPEAALRFSSTTLLVQMSQSRHSRPGAFLIGLRILGLACLIAALARPQQGEINKSVEADGIDIVLTLDLSGSMKALDLSTRQNVVTRLDAAKKVVQEFIDKRPYDRIGLIAFAADAFVVSPLTLNHDWLKKNIQRLELGAIDGTGTAIGTAIVAGINRLSDRDEGSRMIVLLTDGENNSGEVSPVGAAEAARALGIKVYTIATGQQGSVPVPSMSRDGRVLRNSEGQPIYRGRRENSNYDETSLNEIARLTGGQFFQAQRDGDLEQIYDAIDKMETTVIELRSYASLTEYFVWPALAGLFLLLLEQILANTRYRRLP